MKTFAIAFALLMLSAATASAGDVAVSPATLDSMGLASMQHMSDSDGLTVRGTGPFENLFGGSVPSLLGNSMSSMANMVGNGLGGLPVGDQIIGGFAPFIVGDAFNFGGNFPF